jgi:hypothetical protein
MVGVGIESNFRLSVVYQQTDSKSFILDAYAEEFHERPELGRSRRRKGVWISRGGDLLDRQLGQRDRHRGGSEAQAPQAALSDFCPQKQEQAVFLTCPVLHSSDLLLIT